MTPRIWFRVAQKIDPINHLLAKTGLVCLLIFIVLIGVTIWNETALNQLVMLPGLLLFFLSGLGLIHYYFKTIVEKDSKTIDEYMEKSTASQKIMMWYGSTFMTIFVTMLLFMASLIIWSVL